MALALIPVVAGTLRLLQLAGGPEVLPADPRFAGLPLPLVVHIVGATTYALVGALQFAPRFRRRHWAWHRRAGRVLAVAGLCVAGSALWMTLAYSPKPGTGDLLFVLRLTFASAMAALPRARLQRGPSPRHPRPPGLDGARLRHRSGGRHPGLHRGHRRRAVRRPASVRGDLAKGAGWVINLAVAEWVITRPARRRQSS